MERCCHQSQDWNDRDVATFAGYMTRFTNLPE